MPGLTLAYKCRFCRDTFPVAPTRPTSAPDGSSYLGDPALASVFHRRRPGVLGLADLVAVGAERDLELRARPAIPPPGDPG